MSALSKKYTVDTFWKQAIVDLGQQADSIEYQKFELINRVQEVVQSQFADLIAEAYMTATVAVQPSATTKYSSGTGTWTLSTKTLVITMSANFTSADIGNWVTFHIGTNGGGGTIQTVGAVNTITIDGDNLPASGTVTYAIMLPTTPTGDVLDISSLNPMRYGLQTHLIVESSATDTIEWKKKTSLTDWFTSTDQNTSSIACSLVGNNLYLKKGASLASYGTLTIYYPRIPIDVSLTTDYVDLLDGAMVQIGILTLKSLIRRRLHLQQDELDILDMKRQVDTLYNSMNRSVSMEQSKQKIEALL